MTSTTTKKSEEPSAADIVPIADHRFFAHQHRYELYDPFMEVTHRFFTSQDAIKKANAFGCSRIFVRNANGTALVVNRVDGRWTCNDGTLITTIQDEIDIDALCGIKSRAQFRDALTFVDDEVLKQIAFSDVCAFLRIETIGVKLQAAEAILKGVHGSTLYLKSLERAMPGYSNTIDAIRKYAALALSSRNHGL